MSSPNSTSKTYGPRQKLPLIKRTVLLFRIRSYSLRFEMKAKRGQVVFGATVEARSCLHAKVILWATIHPSVRFRDISICDAQETISYPIFVITDKE
ncbi:TPA: hypothetical protein ACVBYD_002219 [Yersinia enterocolitica]|nr:hypothetical protein [Yersinia enterocolitica]HDL8096017.1 hypothetical protein [Yersinia enterocolitica]